MKNGMGDMRRRAKMSVEDVAEKMCVSVSTIRYWEQNSHSLRLDVAVELCRLFGCTLEEIAGVDDLPSDISYVYATLSMSDKAKADAYMSGLRDAHK